MQWQRRAVRHHWCSWLLATLCVPALAAQPQAPADFAACRVLEAPLERLDCYDTVAGREQAAPRAMENADVAVAVEVDEAAEDTGREPNHQPSLVARNWQLVAQADRGPFVITPYRPIYFLPLSYNFRSTFDEYEAAYEDVELQRTELKFQLSLKAKLWPDLLSDRGDLWFGYTQQSYWQAYNTDESSPFRDTNYEPELIYAWRTGYALPGLDSRLLLLGLNHQSNGQGDPLSRSWNRLILGALFDRGPNFATQLRLWWRIAEGEEDDNPDITDYVGRGDWLNTYRRGRNTYSVLLRSNIDPGDLRGAVRLDWAFPLGPVSPVRGYAQYFYGYGDTLLDYDQVSNRIGIGILLTDWL